MRRIYKYEFNEILKRIPNISKEERLFLDKAFAGELVDGLTEYELKQKIALLKAHSDDPIDMFEADEVKRKLSQAIQ